MVGVGTPTPHVTAASEQRAFCLALLLRAAGAHGTVPSCTTLIPHPRPYHHLHVHPSPQALPPLHAAADALVQDLPPALAPVVAADAIAITQWVEALTGVPDVTLKLEVMGWNKCGRWHQDNYLSRVTVTYGEGVPGTWFAEDSNVNFRPLEQGGQDSTIVRDKSRMLAAEIGDICLIKGQKWHGLRQHPGSTRFGAVHRSPDVPLYPDGRLPNRLLLKVDCDIQEDFFGF